MNPTDDNVVEIAGKLTEAQREFILRMKPHARERNISSADWDQIEPCVEIENDGPYWPDTIWFGGMRLTWPNNRAKRTFCFNELGLAVRAHLLSRDTE